MLSDVSPCSSCLLSSLLSIIHLPSPSASRILISPLHSNRDTRTDHPALENLSATSQPVKRHTSTSEKEWLRQLVVKHGDDYEKMSRDKGLNVWQKTPGEIKRMVKKAGGVEKFNG